ncbi:MAG: hypothetical protein IKY45_03830 [Clostridia bacterium]|nr:hypothetical protein [Clostridia bacterium]MBR4973576.1 hypothetical protein [Clostridia bacterium]
MTMNDDIKKYPVYALSQQGLIPIEIMSINDYNHQTHQLHHYIKQQSYKRDKKWFDDRNIEQKLILLPCYVHEQVHNTAIRNLTDSEFEEKFNISRWDLLFNRRYSKY